MNKQEKNSREAYKAFLERKRAELEARMQEQPEDEAARLELTTIEKALADVKSAEAAAVVVKPLRPAAAMARLRSWVWRILGVRTKQVDR